MRGLPPDPFARPPRRLGRGGYRLNGRPAVEPVAQAGAPTQAHERVGGQVLGVGGGQPGD